MDDTFDWKSLYVHLNFDVPEAEIDKTIQWRNACCKIPEATHFQPADFTEVKWGRNCPYTIKDGILYVTPTNFRSLSYLNLEEFTFNARASGFYEYPEHVTETCRMKRVRDIHSLEDSRRDQEIREEIALYVEFEYANRALSGARVGFLVYLQYAIGGGISPASNCRRMEYTETVYIDSGRFFRNQWKEVVRRFRNSKAIVQCFLILFSSNKYVAIEIIISELDFTEYFLFHSRRAGFDGRAFLCGLYRRGEVCDVGSPFLLAFSQKDDESLRLYLTELIERKIPLMLSWIMPEFPSDDSTLWPYLDLYAAPQGYFNSSEFRNRLIADLFWGAFRKRYKKGVTDNIRIVWRALPTPLLTQEDLEATLQFIKSGTEFRLPLSLRSVEFFMKVYPTDCIAEANQPRSLQHLARCAFRQTFKTPLGVPSKSIPTPLRNYVHLKC